MGLNPEIDLRAMVREVLRETIAAHGQANGVQNVTIGSDADLQAFIAQLTAPGAIEAVRTDTLKFRLNPVPSHSYPAAQAAASVTLSGVVSERKLQGLARGTAVRLAASAVLTPMAKDAARRLGLQFERIEE